MYWSGAEDHKWRRLATIVCLVIGISSLGLLSSANAGEALLAILIGAGLVAMAVYSFKVTDNWHTYDSLPAERKIIPALTVLVGFLSVFVFVALIYIIWKAAAAEFGSKK